MFFRDKSLFNRFNYWNLVPTILWWNADLGCLNDENLPHRNNGISIRITYIESILLIWRVMPLTSARLCLINTIFRASIPDLSLDLVETRPQELLDPLMNSLIYKSLFFPWCIFIVHIVYFIRFSLYQLITIFILTVLGLYLYLSLLLYFSIRW